VIDWGLLIAALIAVESGGDPKAVGDGGKAVGILQIHPIMVKECNRILNEYDRKNKNIPKEGIGYRYTLKDRKFESTSRAMAILYLRHWGKHYKKRSGYEPTYEVYARSWNGGPKGPFKESTLTYWQKVRSEMERLRKETEK